MSTSDVVVDVLVIGAGPGGYVAAIRAQKLGLKALCVEKEKLGGVCLNWGCIPSKALLYAADRFQFLQKEAAAFGFQFGGEVTADFSKVVARSRKVALQSERGVQFLFKKFGVTHRFGTARLAGPGEGGLQAVDIEGKDSEGQSRVERVFAKHVIVATGARAKTFPGIQPDGERILTYREAIVRDQRPASAVVLGSGAIGCEFSYLWNSFGAAVTLVEAAPRIVPLEDHEVSEELEKSFKKQGIQIRTGARCQKVESTGSGVKVTLEGGEVLEAEICLLALGVTPNTEGIGLDTLGVRLGRGGFVEHDSSFRTNVPGIYVIGDLAGPPALAHTAYAEAHVCVDRIAGRHIPDVDYGNMPAATYCQPQVASVGMTEAQVKEKGIAYTVGRFPFSANGKARGAGYSEGFVKVLVGKAYGEILGAHLIGHDAAELLANVVMARGAEVTAEHFLHTVHAHPTLGEAVQEAVAEAIGEGGHL